MHRRMGFSASFGFTRNSEEMNSFWFGVSFPVCVGSAARAESLCATSSEAVQSHGHSSWMHQPFPICTHDVSYICTNALKVVCDSPVVASHVTGRVNLPEVRCAESGWSSISTQASSVGNCHAGPAGLLDFYLTKLSSPTITEHSWLQYKFHHLAKRFCHN